MYFKIIGGVLISWSSVFGMELTFFQVTTVGCLSVGEYCLDVYPHAALGRVTSPNNAESQRLVALALLENHLTYCKSAASTSGEGAELALLLLLDLLQLLHPVLRHENIAGQLLNPWTIFFFVYGDHIWRHIVQFI